MSKFSSPIIFRDMMLQKLLKKKGIAYPIFSKYFPLSSSLSIWKKMSAINCTYMLLGSNHLPDEVLLKIFNSLTRPQDLLRSAAVCSSWRRVASDMRLWNTCISQTIAKNLSLNVHRKKIVSLSSVPISFLITKEKKIYLLYQNGELVESTMFNESLEKKAFSIGEATWIKFHSSFVIVYDKRSHFIRAFDRHTTALVADFALPPLANDRLLKHHLQTHKTTLFVATSEGILQYDLPSKRLLWHLEFQAESLPSFFKVKYPYLVLGFENEAHVYDIALNKWLYQNQNLRPYKFFIKNEEPILITGQNDRLEKINLFTTKSHFVWWSKPQQSKLIYDKANQICMQVIGRTNLLRPRDDTNFERHISKLYCFHLNSGKGSYYTFIAPHGREWKIHFTGVKKIEAYGEFIILNGLTCEWGRLEEEGLSANCVWKKVNDTLIHCFNIPLSGRARMHQGYLCDLIRQDGHFPEIGILDYSVCPINQKIHKASKACCCTIQ